MVHSDTIIFHYGEIALKTGNRLFFEKMLVGNIGQVMKNTGLGPVRLVRGRLLAEVAAQTDLDAVKKLMPFLFGVVYAAPAARTAPQMENISAIAVAMMKNAPEGTFKVDVMRSDKNFASTSMEMNAALGEKIIEATGRKVKMRDPNIVCAVELLEKDAYVSVERWEGPGGLPTGSQAPILMMLSGGIDSPVAALRLERRGAAVFGIHFHSYPITTRASLEKVKELAQVISRAQGGMTVFMVPFADIQKATVKFAPPGLRVVLYRRSMFRIAERLANREGILALATGESLGQVASQTVENIAAVSDAIHMPILRPLIGTNKEEIMAEARIYGTFDISIRPHEDCCSLFLPEHPETRAKIEIVRAAEASIEGLPDLESDAIAKLDKITEKC
jgi:thiamine biosynthesis protein ThiI